jgi:dipeptidase E
MKTIVAIGGGEIGRPGYPVETTAIDQEAIALTGQDKPRVLFLPTASSDAEGYVQVAREHFAGRLGCGFEVLRLVEKTENPDAIRKNIGQADMVYVGGGNTRLMLKVWRQHGVDALLKEAWENGTVLSGLSAGAVCWFKHFSSDSDKFSDKESCLVKLDGLGWISASFCPHYDTEPERKPHFKEMMRHTPGVALAADNCAAIIIQDGKYRVTNSRDNAKLYKVYWQDGEFCEKEIEPSQDYAPLVALLDK